MEFEQIEKLMDAMNRKGIRRLSLKRKDFDLELEKESAYSSMAPAPMFAPPPSVVGETPVADAKKEIPEAQKIDCVTSPMVGTFYSSPSPEDPPFVKVGDEVDKDTVMCIIEAMKVMNEVKAGKKGTVKQVLVKNGEPVEFGTKLFEIV